jgi:mRNA interferase RelE/StbE
MYKVTFDKNAKRILKKLKKDEQKKILSKIANLQENPKFGKRLSGNLHGLWKLRFDKYRIFYQIIEDKLIVIVLNIQHRKNIY